MADGMIKLDDPFALEIGFTSDLFDGYLWRKEEYIWISFIESKQQGKGNLTKLFNNITKKGLGIIVPTPLGKMVDILKKKGFLFVRFSDGLLCGVKDAKKNPIIFLPKGTLKEVKVGRKNK